MLIFLKLPKEIKLNMKKIVVLFILLILCFSLVFAFSACKSTTDSTPETADESSVETEGANDDFTPNDLLNNESEDEEQILPPPDIDDEEFCEFFSENIIDKAYFEDLESADTMALNRKASGSASTKWIAQTKVSLDFLSELDEEKYAEQKAIQEEWESKLEDELDKINQKTADAGSLGNIEANYNAMLFYRNRAAEVLYEIYTISGEINITADGEVKG